MEDKKVLLSIEDLNVKFRVRGRILTAIRGITLDIYENETIAIVGESGSGKSVFTKTFAGMLDSNGFISKGKIIFNDPDLADTVVPYGSSEKRMIASAKAKLDADSRYELGKDIHKQMEDLKAEKKKKGNLDAKEEASYDSRIKELQYRRTEAFNVKQTLDPKAEKEQIHKMAAEIAEFDKQIEALTKELKAREAAAEKAVESDGAYLAEYKSKMDALEAKYQQAIRGEISEKTRGRNEILAKEICLSVDRYGKIERTKLVKRLLKELKNAMIEGLDLDNDEVRNDVFNKVAFRVRYLDESSDKLHGICVLNLANVNYEKDWSKIRGTKIATVFQDPMTSLNPIITIGKQITSIILKHQNVTEAEARRKAIELMAKVGIPNPEDRFDDYPFQYSGGMRQRIVIAIALSCQPKILICDEPTTALDVTIQAQILRLIKELQKEFGFTTVFITHDLGVVANVADRVAVLYAGQIAELGTVEEVFYDPRHPYTWALLSSLPQLAQRDTKLFSITGTPPSLYNNIVGDAFAPRNPYCLKVDTLKEPPMFAITKTHSAKTWLLDPRAPKIDKPEAIDHIHEKLINAFNI